MCREGHVRVKASELEDQYAIYFAFGPRSHERWMFSNKRLDVTKGVCQNIAKVSNLGWTGSGIEMTGSDLVYVGRE